MIDFHTHILPHIDDGAKNSDMAVKMLASESAQGVTQVVLTPHYYGRRRSPQQFIEKRSECFARLADRVPEGVTVRLGAEVHFTGLNLPSFASLCSLAIEGTESILFEFPFTEKWHSSILERLEEFIVETEYLPIIAHVERYGEILKRPAILTRLVNMGCLLQVNARSFTDKRTAKFALRLLKKGLVHCIGSDAHDLETRGVDMLLAKATIEKAGLLSRWNDAQAWMKEVLSGKKPRIKTDEKVKKFLGFYF